jgi:hypothetical protein
MAVEVLVLAAAFEAQPTAERIEDGQGEGVLEHDLWAPGANSLMSAHDTTGLPLAPPR